MKYLVLTCVFAAGFAMAHLTSLTTAADPQLAPPQVAPPNPNIDMNGFLTAAQAAAKHRESRRLSEDDFIKMSKEPGVVVLDARSKEMFDMLHIDGAINLSFPDIDLISLKKTLPDKNATILIYCNNNFTPATGFPKVEQGQPVNPVTINVKRAMRPKSAVSSLNLSTYVSLHSYGYKNVYELAPLIDPTKTKLKLVSSEK